MNRLPTRLPAIALASVAGAALLGLALSAHGAADDPAPKAVAEIKDVMLAVNEGDSSLAALVRADFKKEKLDDDAWEVVRARAAMIAEAGNVLLGLKPRAGAADAAGLSKWKKHVADYRACAEEIRAAAEKKDATAGAAAVQGLYKRCAECHKEHRPD